MRSFKKWVLFSFTCVNINRPRTLSQCSNVNEKIFFLQTPNDWYELMQYCKGFHLIPRNTHFFEFYVVVTKKL